jgi:hypothetical protein
MSRWRLAQFAKDAVRALGVEEGDAHVVRAWARRLVDHPNTVLFQLGDSILDVFDRVGDVVESFAPFVEKRCHRAGGICRLEEFEADVLNAEEPDPDFLIGHLLDPLEDGSEGAFVKRSLSLDGTNRDSNVVDRLNGCHLPLLLWFARQRI